MLDLEKVQKCLEKVLQNSGKFIQNWVGTWICMRDQCDSAYCAHQLTALIKTISEIMWKSILSHK